MATATQQFEYPVEEWFISDYARIPERVQEAIKRYLIDRLRPGDFLTAVICNDLRNSISRADGENLELIPLYVGWFYNRAPAKSHGSPEAFEAWLANK